MFDLNKYISLLYEEKFIEADSYRISNMPQKIYKYISLKSMNSCGYTEKCVNEEEENNKKITSIRDNKIWLSTYNNLNDPFELSALYIDEEKLNKVGWPIDDVKTIFEGFKKSFLIGSFTTHLENCLPMWAHYANNHQGICVEYDVEDSSYLYKVSYENSRIPIASIITHIIDGYYLEEEGKNADVDMYLSSVLHSACIKDKSWSYEDEFRILYPNLNKTNYGQLIDIDEIGLKICAVYTGINCNATYKNTLKSICKDLNCKLYKMNIDYSNERFALGKELLDC